MDVEDEIRQLRQRVGDLEGAVNLLNGQMSSLHPDLVKLNDLAVKNFDAIDVTLARFMKRLDSMNTQVWGLRDDLPQLVGEAVRKALPGLPKRN
ncbi:MAG: hypothetical protein C0511_12935 [Hyphomicrobium sp.]|nr:hypothetical protein [Hyphomicrobium sp.]